MPRLLRQIDDGLIYQVINRGNNRQNVIHKRDDFQAFLRAVADFKVRKTFALYSYCLQPLPPADPADRGKSEARAARENSSDTFFL